MKRLLFACLFFFITYAVFSQIPLTTIDSLQKLANAAKEDTTKVCLQLRIGSAYRYHDLAKGHQHIDSAFRLSSHLNFNTGMFKSCILKSALFRVAGNDDSTLFYNKKLLSLAEQYNDTVHIGIACVNLAESHTDFSDPEAALASALKGLGVIENSNQNNLKQDTYDLLLRLYFSRKDYDKAITYGEKAIQIAREMEAPDREAHTLANLAMVYNNQKNYRKSIEASERVLEISKEDGNIRYEAYALANLGEVYLKLNNAQKAKTYFERSLLLARQSNDQSMTSIQLRALGMTYLQAKNYGAAQQYADSALAIQKTLHDTADIILTTKLLADLAFATGNPTKGYAYELQCDEYEQNYIQQVLSKQSADLEKKYETKQKEVQIKSLENEKKLQQLTIKQQRILNYSLIAGAITILIISLLLYRNYRHKQKLQQQRISELETEKQLAATEAVLKGEEIERTRLAKDLHDGLGGMLSGIKYSLNNMKGNLIMTPENAQAFERSIDMLDSSIQEMRRVAHNMMPEALVRFGLDTALKDFCNDINQSGALQITYQSFGLDGVHIEQTTAITIYRIVQELINNTMKHAAAQHAIVQVTKTDGHLSVTVEDDGKGFDTSILKMSKGIGWSSIQNRVAFLQGKMDVDSAPGKGTSVLIELEA